MEGEKMLIISFILTAGLELLIVYNSILSNSWSLVWSFGFLFMISMFSLQAEDSKSGKAARNVFNNIGIKSEYYDIIANILKAIIYILIITGNISYYLGSVLAYLVVFITVIIIYTKFIDTIKDKKEKEDNKK